MEKFVLTGCIYVPQEGIDNPESKSHLAALHEADQQQTGTTACY
jgi:starvation-inducible outer membrane lipoprotein